MTDTLVDLHIAHLQAGGKSPRTIEARRSVLGLLDRALPFGLAYAAAEQIEAWLAGLRASGRSAWTLNVYAYHTFGFFRWATRAGYLDGDPTALIPCPRHPRALPKPVSQDELELALALPDPVGVACALAGFAGLRASEIAGCHRGHVTEELLTVVCGKGGRPGTVPTHPYLWARLCGYPDGPLVSNRFGRRISGHWLTCRARVEFDRAGLTGVHLHRLRHWYGTMIQQATGDLRVTQECLRHQSVQSTQGYTLVTASQRSRAVAALPVPGAPAGSEPAGAGHGHPMTP